jgi:general secretion pathway protein D
MALPNGLLEALMTDRDTRVLQSPQVRAVDGEKAQLRIGDRYPYATGSFQPGVGAVGVSPLVSTQFQFSDVGVNVDLTPRIHGDNEVSLHTELEISSVRDTINVGGLSQPVIGQRKLTVDIRVKDGEPTLVGGLMNVQDTKSVGGVPGLANVPVFKWFFGNEDLQKSRGELVIALVPHIVRSPDITPLNTRGVAAGTDQQVKLNYAPRKPETPPAQEPKPAPAAPAAPVPAPPAVPAPKPPAAAGISFVPAAAETQVGKNVQVNLQVNNLTDVFSTSLRLKFDPKLVKVADVKLGPFLSADGQRVTFSENTLNDTGEALITLNRYPGAGGIGGSGSLLTFTLQPQAPGTAQVTATELTARDSKLQPITLTPPSMTITIK